MKKVLFLFTLLIGLTVSAQEGEMRINMWYGTINNSDVEEHLVLEKHFKSIWKQQKDAGLLTKWEMWQLINPSEATTETTYLYVKFYSEKKGPKLAPLFLIASMAFAISHYRNSLFLGKADLNKAFTAFAFNQDQNS